MKRTLDQSDPRLRRTHELVDEPGGPRSGAAA
jgi:hypothetical protein